MQDPKDRVFWDKYSQIGSKQEGRDINDNKSIAALSDKEVVVTLQNFPYLHDKQRTCDALIRTVHPLIFAKLQRHAGQLQGMDLKMEWSPTHLTHIFKITCVQAAVANFLCTKVIDMSFSLTDTAAHLNMKSSFHIVGQADFRTYFGNYMLTNVVQPMTTAQEDAVKRHEEDMRARRDWAEKESSARDAEQQATDDERLARETRMAQEAMRAAQEAQQKKLEEEALLAAELLKVRMENEELKAKLQHQQDLDDAEQYSLPSDHLGVSQGYDAQA
jgi:hypothetical protein